MSKAEICITIDDSPSSNFREKVDFLYAQDIPALFFCIGDKIKKDPEAIVYAAKKGFLIGNHSYTHRSFSNLSVDEALWEIDQTDRLIKNIFQDNGLVQNKSYFRFPYGDKGDFKNGYEFMDFAEAFIARKNRILRTMFQTFSPLMQGYFKYKKIEGEQRKKVIQKYLHHKDYCKTSIDINYDWYQELLSYYDWSWTFDTYDWAVKTSNGNDLSFFNQRLVQKNPTDTRGNIKGNYSLVESASKEIILMHDYDDNFNTFKSMIIGFINLNFTFINPQ